ncbi:hypothetical protein Q2T40_01505 [Winogradskyella maritima]|nr:hypothetical protein [Winogradskyella maritima]
MNLQPIDFLEQPQKFNIQCAGNVANTDLYKEITIQEVELNPSVISGALFNSGIQEVTIPQLLVSYFQMQKNYYG